MPQLSFFEQDNVTRLDIGVRLDPNGHGLIVVSHLNEATKVVASTHRSWKVARDFLGLGDVLHGLGNHFLYGVSPDLQLTLRALVNEHMPPLPSVDSIRALSDSL